MYSSAPAAANDSGSFHPSGWRPWLSDVWQVQEDRHLSEEKVVEDGAESAPSECQYESRGSSERGTGEEHILQWHGGG